MNTIIVERWNKEIRQWAPVETEVILNDSHFALAEYTNFYGTPYKEDPRKMLIHIPSKRVILLHTEDVCKTLWAELENRFECGEDWRTTPMWEKVVGEVIAEKV